MKAAKSICSLFIVFVFSSTLRADIEEELRQFVEEAVADPQTFVMNPPAELHAYSEMTPESLQKLQRDSIRNGSVLFLYPNGLPFKLQSRKDFKDNGPAKTWYPDGTLQTDEMFENEKLVMGRYFSGDGKLLAEVRDGRGKQIEFNLTDGGKGSVIRRETEYVDGLKEGRERTYLDYAKRQISTETTYKKGEKNGVEKGWKSSGQLNSQVLYANGKMDGDSIYWHENGTVQSLAHYDHGTQVGNSGRYEKNGQKIEETIRDGSNTLMEMKWYPGGAMMVFKNYDPVTHRLTNAMSFDQDGSANGRVENGAGALVLTDESFGGSSNQFYLEVFRKDGPSTRKPLPMLRWNSASGEGNTMALGLTTSDVPDFDELECVIQPPASDAQPITINRRIDQPGVTPTKIPLPTHSDNWSGTIYGHTTAKGPAGTFHFTQVVYSKEPERAREKPSYVSRPEKPARPHQMYFPRLTESAKLEINGVVFPPLERSLGGWSWEKRQWVLFEKPPAILYRDSSESPWEILRKFDFRPAGIVMLGNEHLLVWGTKATSTPERGIPYVVEESLDGGRTWKVFSIPEVDYLTRMMVQNGILIISGIRLPKEGLPAEKDWFELIPTHFVSNDEGQHFTEQIGPSFLQIGTVVGNAGAPDGRKRAYVMDSSFLDPSYEIYLSDEPDAIPRPLLFVGSMPEVVWSANSQFIALRHEGNFFASYDLSTGKSEKGAIVASKGTLTKKQQVAQSEIDRNIRTALEAAQ